MRSTPHTTIEALACAALDQQGAASAEDRAIALKFLAAHADYYTLLVVARDATAEEITQAIKARRAQSDDAWVHQALTNAEAVLGDAALRAQYNAALP